MIALGIIPTRMGTRRRLHVRKLTLKDHPHAYGDKKPLPALWAVVVGSSPRVWGQEDAPDKLPTAAGIIPTRMGTSCRFFDRERQQRIIPTRMGTRASVSLRAKKVRDHPHAYGDKTTMFTAMEQDEGSSPRVWGQACARAVILPRKRIIPTRMGTSCARFCKRTAVGDHPHAYGDKSRPKCLLHPTKGSSPRVWGQVTIRSNGAINSGIIPTRMGTSCVL